MIVRRYLAGLFLVRTAGTLLALAAILQLLDLLDQAGQVVAHGGVSAIGHYVLLRFPSLLAGAVPLGVLAGALLCFMRLSGGSEMIALRATGSSLSRMVGLLLPACALVAALQFALQAEIAPRSARALSNWWERTRPPGPPAPASTAWLRIGQQVIAVHRVSTDGRALDGVLIVHRSPAGDLVDRIDAASARFDHQHWTLLDVSIARPDGRGAERQPEQAWPDGPSPANMVDAARPVGSTAIERLFGILRGRWASTHGPLAARTAIDLLVASLLDPAVMVLLAAPLLLARPRAGIDGLQALRTIGLGLGYLGLSGLLSAMGDSGTLPPGLATSMPVLLFGGVGLSRLLQADAG